MNDRMNGCDLTIPEFIEYWKKGNDQWVLDNITLSLMRLDLAAASDALLKQSKRIATLEKAINSKE